MEKEFPELEFFEYQNEFLSDWYSKKKLFYGKRQTGKSQLLRCEGYRFLQSGMNGLFLTTNKRMARDQENHFKSFIDAPSLDVDFESYGLLKGVRGKHYDFVLLDELQSASSISDVARVIEPMDYMFLRATFCKSQTSLSAFFPDGDGSTFFDSIYKY